MLQNSNSEEESIGEVNCNDIHIINNWHGESFLAFVLYRHLEINNSLDGPVDEELIDSIKHLETLFCEHSKYAYI